MTNLNQFSELIKTDDKMKTKNIKIKFAENKQIIVEKANSKPLIYTSINELVLNEFIAGEIYAKLLHKEEDFELSFSFEINPPKCE
jgi:hypothetical protein